MADKLDTLLRLRRLQADLARLDLARTIVAERAAEATLHAARAAPAYEASLLPAGSEAAYGQWLPQAMRVIAQNTAELREASAERTLAAAEAARRKAGQEAVAQLVSERHEAARKHALRRAQVALDEIRKG